MPSVAAASAPHPLIERARGMMHDGRTGPALDCLEALVGEVWDDPHNLGHIGECLIYAQQSVRALEIYRRAVELTPNEPKALYNLSTALIGMGEMAEAEEVLDKVIALDPYDFDAYQTRSTLRKQTADRNHVPEMEALITRAGAGRGEVQLGYALSKELEDLGDYKRAFAYLRRGAERRRLHLSYDVRADVAAMCEIAKAFDADYLCDARSGVEDVGPIFVMGLPRSGTTLIDRIISSHDQVQSLGEINDFALCLTRLAKGEGAGKIGLIRAARELDPAALGAAYLASVQGYGTSRVHFIDKTPANYLYIGLILKALPKAKIVHLRRDPMDNLYALYKTLFRMGCPYSYDQEDLGTYYVAYQALMKHWRCVAGERLIEIDYEAMVANQEGQTRRLIAALGLGWQDGCLNFHENKSAAATASAAQVRQPIYKTSVALWRHYETELSPLIAHLRAGGIEVAT